MPKLLFILILLFPFIMVALMVGANNIDVVLSGGSLVNLDTAGGTVKVQFDISWENFWRNSRNYDSAWVFVKYSADSGSTWSHATLKASGTNPTGYSTGTGTNIDIVVPLDKKGCFIQPSASGSGTLDTDSLKLVWDYSADGVSSTDTVRVKVFALEMVYIPEGSFYAGDGTAASGGTNSHFYDAGNPPNAVLITSTQPYIDSSTTSSTAGDIRWVAESGAAGVLPANRTQLNADYPTGYKAFYMMKYEVSEGQWVDFFNTLTAAQKTERDITDSTGKNSDTVVYRNTVSWTSGDAATTRPDRACNYINWADVAAYTDWAALRLFTELEFEKAARGSGQPILFECAWGTATIVPDASLTISGTEDGTETITTDLSLGACLYGNNVHTGGDGGTGPLRCGIFAVSSSTRVTAGAGYYGVMELSGNLYERPVTVGNTDGRDFIGTHGDGDLSTSNSDWPGADAVGGGFRGGSWDYDVTHARVSHRYYAASTVALRYYYYGGRCVRASP